MKKRILIISYRLPWPSYGGGNIARVLNIAKIFKKEYEVSILTLIEKKGQKEYINELKKEFNEIIYFFQPRVVKYLNAIRVFLSGVPLQVGYFYSKEIDEWLEKNHQNYDILYFNTIRTAQYSKNFENKKILDFVDAISLNYKSTEKWANFFWKLIYKIEAPVTLKYEINILNKNYFNKIFIASPFDKRYLEDSFGSGLNNLAVLPNGVSGALLERKILEKEENWISFLGRMDYKPNEDAVCYFAKKIFPAIRENFPGLEFYIIGINPSSKIKKLEKESGVKVTGFVKDAYSILEKSKLVVVPLRFGSGTQYKILEAMALGKAVVTTDVGSRGIDGINGQNFLLIDLNNKKETVERISELIKNREKCKIIGNNAKILISGKYTWEKIGQKLLKEIEYI